MNLRRLGPGPEALCGHSCPDIFELPSGDFAIIGADVTSEIQAAALRRDRKARRVSDLLSLSAQHRELWSDMISRPDLRRVTAQEVDLIHAPLSVPEEEFLNLVFSHFFLWWLLSNESKVVPLDTLRSDAATFFALPLPNTFWQRTRETRPPQFVEFIEGALRKTTAQ